MKILLVVGARPNFMKIAPIITVIDRWNGDHPERPIQRRLIHTGQHYDEKTFVAFFRDLEIPPPDVDLEVGSGTHTHQTAHVMLRFETVCAEEAPDWVLVVGDVNSTMAATLVATKMGIRVCHVEAGLRSGDRTMPEELNRLVTDAVADPLFTTSRDADENLKAEGVATEKIVFVGNVMIDTLQRQLARLPAIKPVRLVPEGGRFGVVTLHRPSNMDQTDTLTGLLDTLAEISRQLPLIFPIHPRTRKMASQFGLAHRFVPLAPCSNGALPPGIHVTDPLGYHDFPAPLERRHPRSHRLRRPAGGDHCGHPVPHPAREHRAARNDLGGDQYPGRHRPGHHSPGSGQDPTERWENRPHPRALGRTRGREDHSNLGDRLASI